MSQVIQGRPATAGAAFAVLGALSTCHLLNDMLQSLFVAAYPIFKGGLNLSFGQIGFLTLTYQVSDGCENAMALWREVREHGFAGSHRKVDTSKNWF